MKRIAVTGAAGNVGVVLRAQLLAQGYALHGIDIKPVEPLASGETACQIDIGDFKNLANEFRSVDGVIHQAACTTDADWSQQFRLSIEGAVNVFEAARANGIERMVYASSHHVVGLHPRAPEGQVLGSREILLPDSRYGVAKAFGESLGAMFAYKYGMRVMAVRIGNLNTRPIDRRRLGNWVSARDLAQLTVIGLEHPDLRFEIVYGISDRTGRHYNNASAYALGYEPQDGILDSEIERIVLKEDPPPEASEEKYRSAEELSLGGIFSEAEFVGSAERLYE